MTSISKKGIVLAEVMILLVLVGLTLTAGFVTVARGRDFASISENRIKAINLAREGIEIATNIRDSNWRKFSSSYDTCWNVYQYDDDCANGGTAGVDYQILSGVYTPTTNTGNSTWNLISTGANMLIAREGFRVFLGPNGIEQGVTGSQPACIASAIPTGSGFCKLDMYRDITVIPDGSGSMDVRVRVLYFDPPSSKTTTLTLSKTLTNWAKSMK